MSEGTEGTVNDGAVNGNLLAHQDAGASCGCGCGDSAAVEGNNGPLQSPATMSAA